MKCTKKFKVQKVDFPENSFSYVATKQVLTKISWMEVKIREKTVISLTVKPNTNNNKVCPALQWLLEVL